MSNASESARGRNFRHSLRILVRKAFRECSLTDKETHRTYRVWLQESPSDDENILSFSMGTGSHDLLSVRFDALQTEPCSHFISEVRRSVREGFEHVLSEREQAKEADRQAMRGLIASMMIR